MFTTTGLQFVLGHTGNVDLTRSFASMLPEKTTNSVLLLVPQLKGHVIEFLCINHHRQSLSKLHCYYCIAGNFCEVQIFAIFVIECQVVKISSCENFFLPKCLPEKLRKLSALPSSLASGDRIDPNLS